MKILITGTAGFIGYHLSKKLIERGDTVIGVDQINDYYDIELKYSRLKDLGIEKDNIIEGKKITSSIHSNHSFYKGNLEDKDFRSSENGFWYHYNSKAENDSITPKFGDQLEYSYNVSDLNGNEIYSKNDIGTQYYTMDKEELFSGLREGLKLMKASENITFIFPSQKAYGYYGDDNKIGTNVPLIYNVTLKTISQNND